MGKKFALLTHFIAPYRLTLYKALTDHLGELRVFICTPMEPNRPWNPDWKDLKVTLQKNFTLWRTWRHPAGFSDTLYVQIPYDTLWQLWKYRPDVIISQELGMRTLQAIIYRKLNPKSRIILWALYSEATEQGRGRLREWLRHILLPHTDAVLVNGESGARYIHRFGVADEKIFRVFQPIDVSIFSAVNLHRDPSQATRLLYVGQLIERKGLLPFMKALEAWAKDHPEKTIELWLVGDGPLQATLEGQNLPRNVSVRFWGNVEYAKLPEIYAQAGILAFPTLADEWGLVVNEAMAAGLPILGSLYSQAVEELCVEGKTGWIFRPDQESEIYGALDRALSTPVEVLETMRVTVRDRIQHLTPEFVADRFLQAIEYVLEEEPGLSKNRRP